MCYRIHGTGDQMSTGTLPQVSRLSVLRGARRYRRQTVAEREHIQWVGVELGSQAFLLRGHLHVRGPGVRLRHRVGQLM